MCYFLSISFYFFEETKTKKTFWKNNWDKRGSDSKSTLFLFYSISSWFWRRWSNEVSCGKYSFKVCAKYSRQAIAIARWIPVRHCHQCNALRITLLHARRVHTCENQTKKKCILYLYQDPEPRAASANKQHDRPPSSGWIWPLPFINPDLSCAFACGTIFFIFNPLDKMLIYRKLTSFFF